MNSYTFELNNAHESNVQIKNKEGFKKVVEVCSALLQGKDLTKYGKMADKVVAQIKGMGERAANGDSKAIGEINEIVKFVVQPKLNDSLKVLSFLGNYHELKANQLPEVKTYTYDGIDAREQAAGGDVRFAARKFIKYNVPTQTISSGIAVNYRELANGNFDGSLAEETAQVQTDMTNKGVAYAMDVLKNAVSKNTDNVHFYSQYSGELTQTGLDEMIAKIRRMGKVSITGDYAVLSKICDFNGYKTIGSTTIPFFTPAQVDEIAKSGLNGFYKGSTLVELPNPYNFLKPTADKSAFETYLDTDTLYMIAQGNNSPFNIFRRGGITTQTGNDVETGELLTRFDTEIGADVAKGREFEIGMMTKG